MGDATLSNVDSSTGNETISYKVPSLHLGYLLRPEKNINFFVKGGISAITNKASSDTVVFRNVTDVQASFGLGAQWQAEDSDLFIRLGSDFFDRDAIALGLNIGYKFNDSTKTYER